MKTRRLTILFLVSVFLVSCASKTDFDIRGEWEYKMTASDGNTYDVGTITFNGEPAKLQLLLESRNCIRVGFFK